MASRRNGCDAMTGAMKPSLGHGRLLRLLPAFTVAIFLLPVIAGLLGTLLPSFGYLPELGGRAFSLDPWRRLFAAPELPGALLASLASGLGATLLSFLLAVAIAATLHGTRLFARLRHLLAPLLAMPHAALALGFAFLIAPSGWLMRLAAPFAGSDGVPPAFSLLGDRWGLALMAGLVLKETPFLLLAIAAGLGQLPAEAMLATSRLLGYRPATAWLKTILPPLYRQLRLPIYAVLAYSLSVVDMAIILGPSTPPTLAVQLLRWFDAADLVSIFPAAAGAALQILLVGAAILLWHLGEHAVGRLAANWLVAGGRGHLGSSARGLGSAVALGIIAFSLIAILSLVIWSLSESWRYPALLPQVWTFDNWMRPGLDVLRPFLTSLWLALAATAIALLLSLGCLENERRHGLHPTARVLWLIYLPLLVPQISFLFGTQTLFAWLGIDASAIALDLEPSAVRAALRLPDAGRSLARAGRALHPHRTLPGRGSWPAFHRGDAAHAAAPDPGSIGRRLLRQHRALPAHAVRRLGPLRQFDHRGDRGECRWRPAHRRSLRLPAGGTPAARLRRGADPASDRLSPSPRHARPRHASGSGAMSGLVLDDVALSLDGRPLLGPLDLAIAPGEVRHDHGPVGQRQIEPARLHLRHARSCLSAAEGGFELDGDDITDLAPERRHLGILFQDDLLFPHLSVGGNLAFGLPAGLSSRERDERVAAALDEAGLGGFARRDPGTLSGGQRARVSLLRMLLSQPRALLLDEPFGRLDSLLRHQFRQLVFDRARANSLPVLMVSHDMADAEAARGKIITVGHDLTNKPAE